MRIKWRFSLIIAGLVSLACPTQGAPAPLSAPPVAPATTPPLTKSDLDAWLDGLMPYALNSSDVAGAVVVVVKDGAIVTERGFGYADVAARRPVDPSATLFRPGSTSKLFTWTAVMQLVQAGKIDLDADINTYLDFKIPPYRGQPVTMREIMTHTSGFEEALEGLMSSDGHAPPLEAVVKHWTPKRVFAPGTTPAYSNYATLLAGYVVQRVSGEPYDGYIQHHILQPLGMNHSTFAEPVPPAMAPNLSKGYALASQPPKPFEVITFRPAGSATVTGEDMARFMIAHLDEDHNPLLDPQTSREMHRTALTVIPPLNRMELGFYEQNLNGHRIIAHGGDTLYFHSYLWLLPDQKVGVFFSMNSAGKGISSLTIRDALIESFMDRYYPALDPGASGFTPRPADAAAVAGVYAASRRSESGVRRALNFFTQFTVTADAKGGLNLPGAEFQGVNGAPRPWVEVAPFVWKDLNSNERLAAKVVNGKADRFSVDSFSPFEVYDRAPWYASTAWLKPGLMISSLVLAVMVLTAPFGWIARRYYAADRRLAGQEWSAYLACTLLALATLAILGAWITSLVGLRFQALGAGTYGLEILTILVLPLLVLACAWFLATGLAARRGLLSLALRAVLTLASVCPLWFAIAFNLTHLGLNY